MVSNTDSTNIKKAPKGAFFVSEYIEVVNNTLVDLNINSIA
ncbi:hypothetical protein VCR12J2_1370126 [Vibrio coralliirubri]|uniref:Uncharacterized protein n=1 Tax=Vibrio coralliirubri TaxID=1516159 RepID=A0AA87BYT2_9VIBR|nr:hypothetical protein VCR4J2_20053 [Vibrio coralliirubri]CDT62497.1 hypothetical protein VCR31J2_1270629 [Vibrio coralliirubri]CDT69068.1 hypothetical protein VCR15J2_470650 [Vibrio coralliirubri]CDT87841.1 hypothetical protein VCR12J2_1370126 [Vibrio coralliirubri]CDU11384.1 hypothetical protein VCR17J2_20113 [Vibrio coralliirubri]